MQEKEMVQKKRVIIDFILMVEEMRFEQKSFINERENANKKTGHLEAAKELEREVDQSLTRFTIEEDHFTYRV